MTDIIKLAREAGATVYTNQNATPPLYSFTFTPEQIERFAELVAAPLKAENEALNDKYSRLKKMVDDGSIQERTYSAGIELLRENDALKEENAQLVEFVKAVGGFWGYSKSLLVGKDSLAEAINQRDFTPKPLTPALISYLFQSNKAAIVALPGGSEGIEAYRTFLVRMIESAHGITAARAKDKK